MTDENIRAAGSLNAAQAGRGRGVGPPGGSHAASIHNEPGFDTQPEDSRED